MAKPIDERKQAMKEFIALGKIAEENLLQTQVSFLPEEWQRLEDHVPKQPHREKVTMYLDKAMVREFKKMGPNWQSYVRALLTGYMGLVKSGILPAKRMDF